MGSFFQAASQGTWGSEPLGDPPVVSQSVEVALDLKGMHKILFPGWRQGYFPTHLRCAQMGTRRFPHLLIYGSPGHQTNPVPSPGTMTEEPSHHRLRGSHISFNSNIRVLNIQRARGQGGIYSASKYTASTDRDKLKTAREEKVLLAPPQLGWGSHNAKRWRRFYWMPPGAGFPQENKEVLSDVKPVTK